MMIMMVIILLVKTDILQRSHPPKYYFGRLFRVERVISDTARASTIISQAH